jgi:hypothetical protein
MNAVEAQQFGLIDHVLGDASDLVMLNSNPFIVNMVDTRILSPAKTE